MAPGCSAFQRRRSRSVIESASEQPAVGSGLSTSLSGFTILAVSAMKYTPHMTMTAASVLRASTARPEARASACALGEIPARDAAAGLEPRPSPRMSDGFPQSVEGEVVQQNE